MPDLKALSDPKFRPLIVAVGICVPAAMLLASGCLCVGGCLLYRGSTPERDLVFTNGPEYGSGDTITFDNDVWKSTDEITFGVGLIPGRIYRPVLAEDERLNDRLLVMQRKPDDPGTIRRQLITERLIAEKWVRNGLYQDWTRDGETSIVRYVGGGT